MPQKSWAVGEEVLAADFNSYVQNQVIPQFASTALRDSGWLSPPEGAMCVVTANNTLYQRVSSSWYTFHGTLSHIERTTDAGPALGEAAIGSMATSLVTIPAGRRIRVEAGARGFTGTAGEGLTLRIREGTSISGTVVMENIYNLAPSGAQAGSAGGGTFGRTYTPSGGPKQWCLTAQGSANVVTVLATATGPMWLEARDVGPA